MPGTRGDAGAKSFAEGDLVVYPNHGAGCIAGIEEKDILGSVRRYYIVYLPDTELTLSIPADGDLGLRACADEEGVSQALTILKGDVTTMPQNWNHRLKHNQEKIRSGEILQVAEVVRNLSALGTGNGLSTGERNMLLKARQILTSEIALVRGIEPAEAERLLDSALKDGAK
ncbi:MAG: CarD family transcriptional regulator [Actinomycetota bacterium]|jgi:CarD family transcriptional regulator|nr:CarD family transcriptional regulator [Actinomycetota bacterium]